MNLPGDERSEETSVETEREEKDKWLNIKHDKMSNRKIEKRYKKKENILVLINQFRYIYGGMYFVWVTFNHHRIFENMIKISQIH